MNINEFLITVVLGILFLGMIIGILFTKLATSCEETKHLPKCINLQCEDYCMNEYNSSNYEVIIHAFSKSVCSCYSVEGVELDSVSLKREQKDYKGRRCV